MAIELVVFDLGRVLVRICRDWAQACAEAGVTPPGPEVAAKRAELLAVVERSETGQIDQQAFCAELAGRMAMDPAHVHAASTCYLLGPYPGVAELLEDLEAQGVRTACLSNTNAHHWAMMSQAGHRNDLGLHRLTYRFASHLAGLRKPDAAIYELVERETRTPADRILFFDDLPENIDAALARGWKAEVIADDGDPASQMRRHLARYDVL